MADQPSVPEYAPRRIALVAPGGGEAVDRAARGRQRIGLGYRKRVEYKGFTDVVWFDVNRADYAASMSIAAR